MHCCRYLAGQARASFTALRVHFLVLGPGADVGTEERGLARDFRAAVARFEAARANLHAVGAVVAERFQLRASIVLACGPAAEPGVGCVLALDLLDRLLGARVAARTACHSDLGAVIGMLTVRLEQWARDRLARSAAREAAGKLRHHLDAFEV